MVRYSDRMAHDNFDGRTGFAIDGGLKDATYVISCRYLTLKDLMYRLPLATFAV